MTHASIEPSLFSDGNDGIAVGHIYGKDNASIEPSLFSDGNLGDNVLIVVIQKASIEPSLFSDGNIVCNRRSPRHG